jgi:deoxycytidylate deaminase
MAMLRDAYWEGDLKRGPAEQRETHRVEIRGLTSTEEEALKWGLADVMDPEKIALSECNHRGCVASLSVALEPTVDYEENYTLLGRIQDFCYENGIAAKQYTEIDRGGKRQTVVNILGVNTWLGTKGEALNCKTAPGTPWEVPAEALRVFPGQQIPIVNGIGDVDLACPKRTLGKKCEIVHAERNAIEGGLALIDALDLKYDKLMLCSTWIPCPDCLQLIIDHRDKFRDSWIISAYRAQGDEEDLRNGRAIVEMFNATGLNHLHGPFLEIPKNPGYGWLPANIDLVIDSLERVVPGSTDLLQMRHLAYSAALRAKALNQIKRP